MSYNITPNTFKVETEVRKEVVQRLIDYFMRTKQSCWNEFVPNCCWRQNSTILKEKFGGEDESKWKDVLYSPISGIGIDRKDKVKIRTSEMVEFCKIWRENGYFISRGIEAHPRGGRSAIVYKFTIAPFTQYGFKVVSNFTDEIE